MWYARAAHALPAPAPDVQAGGAIDALYPFVIYVHAVAFQAPVQTPIAPPRFLNRQALEALLERRVIAQRAVAHRRTGHAREATRATLGNRGGGHRAVDRVAPQRRSPHGLPNRSFRTWMLSA